MYAVKHENAIDDSTWSALSDASRRKILDLLRQRPMTTGEICEHFEITEEFYRSIKSRADIYLAEYSCIPPLPVRKNF